MANKYVVSSWADLQDESKGISEVYSAYFSEPKTKKKAAGEIGCSLSKVSLVTDQLCVKGYLERTTVPDSNRVAYKATIKPWLDMAEEKLGKEKFVSESGKLIFSEEDKRLLNVIADYARKSALPINNPIGKTSAYTALSGAYVFFAINAFSKGISYFQTYKECVRIRAKEKFVKYVGQPQKEIENLIFSLWWQILQNTGDISKEEASKVNWNTEISFPNLIKIFPHYENSLATKILIATPMLESVVAANLLYCTKAADFMASKAAQNAKEIASA